MSTSLNLRGGLEGNSNGHVNGEKPADSKNARMALQKARREIAARRELNLDTFSEEPIVREADGSMSAKEIAAKVGDLAQRALPENLAVGDPNNGRPKLHTPKVLPCPWLNFNPNTIGARKCQHLVDFQRVAGTKAELNRHKHQSRRE